MEITLESIQQLKKEKNAVILAHNYTLPEVQDVADYVGDSLGLSRKAAETEAEIIIFCGVSFMGETAKILNPDKKVLLPEPRAGCSMASMCTAAQVREMRRIYPDAAVVAYVNTTADVKAESDICCTSSNSIKATASLEEEDIIFIPDMNLAAYTANKLPEKNIIPFHGYCSAHHGITTWQIEDLRTLHPGADIVSHPECTFDVLAMSDFIGSTEKMIDFVRVSDNNEFIIATEVGMLYRLRKVRPDAKFYFPPNALCQTIKMTNLRLVYRSLVDGNGEVILDPEISRRARIPVERMLSLD
ncbi:MAG: quinolinate synthase [Candidatus Methanomethylophilaceae archaeon]|nr:quinolinate synthase [Candidatus Methanomethylophilaceae archaeon]